MPALPVLRVAVADRFALPCNARFAEPSALCSTKPLPSCALPCLHIAMHSRCFASRSRRTTAIRPDGADFAQLRRALAPLHVAMPLLRNAPLCLADAPDAVLSPLCCSVALLNRASPMRREPKLRPSRAMHVLARPSLCGRSASEPWPNCPLRCRCVTWGHAEPCDAELCRRYA